MEGERETHRGREIIDCWFLRDAVECSEGRVVEPKDRTGGCGPSQVRFPGPTASG